MNLQGTGWNKSMSAECGQRSQTCVNAEALYSVVLQGQGWWARSVYSVHKPGLPTLCILLLSQEIKDNNEPDYVIEHSEKSDMFRGRYRSDLTRYEGLNLRL